MERSCVSASTADVSLGKLSDDLSAIGVLMGQMHQTAHHDHDRGTEPRGGRERLGGLSPTEGRQT